MTSHERDPDAWPPRRRRIVTWRRVAVLCALLLFVSVGWLWRQSHRLSNMLDDIRARGEPTTWKELADSRPQIPKELDATQLWLGAAGAINREGTEPGEQFAKVPFFGAESGDPDLPTSWESLDSAVAFLDQNQAVLKQLHMAAAMGGAARYPFDPGQTVHFNFGKELRDAKDVLMLEADVSMRQDDLDGAVEAIAAIAALGRSLANEPATMPQLSRNELNRGANRQALNLLWRGGAGASHLTRLAGELDPVDWREQSRMVLLDERIDGIAQSERPSDLFSSDFDAAVYPLFYAADMREFLGCMARMIGACKLPIPAAIAEVKNASGNLDDGGKYSPLTNDTGDFGQFIDSFRTSSTQREVVRVAIAIERFRVQHDALPTALSELSPELLPVTPIDPATGSAYSYVVDGEGGYVLYSDWNPGGVNEKIDPATGADERLLFRRPNRDREESTPAAEDEMNERTSAS